MEPSAFDEMAFFRSVQESGARALLIGRRALVLLGLPVLTADYDFWLAIDDIPLFNAACARHDLRPDRDPEEARRRGRYVLENDERIDVLIARAVPTIHGQDVRFEQVWSKRRMVELQDDLRIPMPSIDDLILTKQFGSRPKDLEDIRLLRALKAGEQR